MADLNKLAEDIVGLTLLQAQELKTILKDKYGIEPAAGGAVMMAAGPAAAAEVAYDTGSAMTLSLTLTLMMLMLQMSQAARCHSR